MFILAITFILFMIIAFLPFALEKLFSASDLAEMGIRLENL